MENIIEYPSSDNPTQGELFNLYNSNIDNFKKLNDTMVNKNEDDFRIMTYNIHYWAKKNAEYKDEPNHIGIINNIRAINPDICCLQEVNFAKTKYITTDFREAINEIGYELLTYCTTTPSWFKVPYGNAILIKKSLLENLEFSQKNHIYQNNSKGKSTKCFVEINLSKIRIICTHLDVHDNSGIVRIKQISELDDYTSDNKPTIFLGDFNLINENDANNKSSIEYIEKLKRNRNINGMAYDYMKKLGWIDTFDIKPRYKPQFTTWNLTRIDYIMFKNIESATLTSDIKKAGVYYSNESDHIPVFIDLDKTVLFSDDELSKLISDDKSSKKISSSEYMADTVTTVSNELFTLKWKSDVNNEKEYSSKLTKYLKGNQIFGGKIKYLDDLINLKFTNAQDDFNVGQWWVKQDEGKIVFNSDSNGHLGDPYMVGISNNDKNRETADTTLNSENKIDNSQGHLGIYGKYTQDINNLLENTYAFQWQNVHQFKIKSLPIGVKVGIDTEETDILRWKVTNKRYEYDMILSNGTFKINPKFFSKVTTENGNVQYESQHLEFLGMKRASDGGYKKKYLKYKSKYLALKKTYKNSF